jgi:hypothetical protein
MKFSVNAKNFLDAIIPVLDVSQKGGRKDFDGVDRINISVDDEDITVSSYNGNMAVRGKLNDLNVDDLNVEFDDEGEVSVNTNHLRDTLLSFPGDENVIFDLVSVDGSKELKIISASDNDQYQTIICFDELIELPEVADKIKNNIKVSRDVFSSSVNKIKFAFGYEQEKDRFLYWVMRATNKPKNLRFVSGTGGLFSILDVEGDCFSSDSTDDFDILFRNEHMPVVLNILSKSKKDMITIKETDKNDNYQIIIDSGLFNITLVGINTDVEWIDENKLLDSDYSYRVVTSIEDWAYACKGVSATHTKEMIREKRMHKSRFNLDIGEKVLQVKAEETLKSYRKIKVIDSSSPDGENICLSSTYTNYIQPIPECWEKEGNIQIEFCGESGRKPILVYFNASDTVAKGSTLCKTNVSTGFSEKFAIILVQLSS